MNTAAPAIAAHRFGLGEPTLNTIQPDPQGWLLAQIGPADAAIGDGLLSTPQALAHVRAEAENRRLAKNPPPGMAGEQALDNGLGKRVANGYRGAICTSSFSPCSTSFQNRHFTIE